MDDEQREMADMWNMDGRQLWNSWLNLNHAEEEN